MTYRFEGFELDPSCCELKLDGNVVALEPRAFDLLVYLIERHHRVVSKDELFDDVWGSRHVSESALTKAIRSVRTALGDDGKAQRLIRNVHGRGYRFVGTLATEQESTTRQPQESNSEDPLTQTSLPIVDSPASSTFRPSLAILPLDVFGSGERLPAIAEGLSENLTTVLTRVPTLSVSSRTSSFAVHKQGLTARQAGEQLGAHYLVEGSVQGAGEGALRVNVQLIDVSRETHIWAQQFERPGNDEALELLLRDILPHLELHLIRAIHQALASLGEALSAQQLMLQATSLLSLKGWHKTTFEQAAELLRQSVAIDPELALAHAHLSLILGLGHRFGLLEQSDELAEEVIRHADKSLDIDQWDSAVVSHAACALADVGRRHRAIPLLKQALELNNNNAHAWVALGAAYQIEGQLDEALELLAHGIAISPMDKPLGVWRSSLAGAYLLKGDIERALHTAEQACQNDSQQYLPWLTLTVIHLVSGDQAKAGATYQETLRVKPDLSQHEVDCSVGRKLGKAITELAVTNLDV